MFQASQLIIKNTERTRNFIKQWLDLCTNEQLLTDIPSKVPEYTDFIDHRHDQALLSLLYYKERPKILLLKHRRDCPFNNHRRRSALSPIPIMLKN